MKALSLRQPWAEFVLRHGKRIENRRWNTKFRGEFLLHAAKGMTRSEYEDAITMLSDVRGAGVEACPFDLPKRGGIVGVATLVSVIPPRTSSLFSVASHYPAGVEWRWHMPEQYGFVLENVRPTKFVPLRGELGFFDVADDVVKQALEAA